jgi:hypothetical protein
MQSRLRVYRAHPSLFYLTDSIEVAAFLNLALGPKLIDIETEGQKAYFVFSDPVACKLLSREYAERTYVGGNATFATFWDDVGVVAAHRFARSLKLMREEASAALAGEPTITAAINGYS